MRLLRAFASAAAIALLLASLTACADVIASGEAPPSGSLSPTPKPEYPKEVPIDSLDSRFRTWLGSDRGKTVAVQLAPGVYAERGSSSDLGTLDDYSLYVGWCSDVKRYTECTPVDTPAGNSGRAALRGPWPAHPMSVVPVHQQVNRFRDRRDKSRTVNGRNRCVIPPERALPIT